MSRLRVYLGCSLDGCIAGPNHDLSFLDEHAPEPDAQGGLSFEDFLSGIGVLLMGRRTYQVLLDYDVWPYGDRLVLVATHHELPSVRWLPSSPPLPAASSSCLAHASTNPAGPVLLGLLQFVPSFSLAAVNRNFLLWPIRNFSLRRDRN